MDTVNIESKFHPEHWNDLQKSGLSTETITASGIRTVLPGQIGKLLGWDSPNFQSALAFPYPGSEFVRLKVFPAYKDSAGHKIKYLQRKKSGVHLYIPPSVQTRLLNQTDVLYITEGEKKALKGSQEGICCVGIGGVWNWKEGDELMSEIKQLPLIDRSVVLIPDSDFNQNAQVVAAMKGLGTELEKLGAKVRLICLLQNNSTEKVGLDDYLVTHTIEEMLTLPQIGLSHPIFKNSGKKKAAELPKERRRYAAIFPELVDIVDDNGSPSFLVVKAGSPQVVKEFGQEDILIPPPGVQLPWLLPRAAEILRIHENNRTEPTSILDETLFNDLETYHRSISELPTDAHYMLLAAWDMHTYLMEAFHYSPILAFFAVPERGKSRTGKGLIYLAYRGIHTETLQEANLFRWAENLGVTLFIDVRDLWAKAEKRGSDDLLLARFERGQKVARVLHPELGPFNDTCYFNVFGPTIVATNEALHHILETRCIPITMPQSMKRFETVVTPETALPFKERLVAFRLRHLNESLPYVQKPASGRLGDILSPLLQIIKLAAPSKEESFMRLVKSIEKDRKVEKSLGIEAEIIRAVESCRENVINGFLPAQDITEALNVGRSEKFTLTPHRVARRLKALGFEKGTIGNGQSAILYDADQIQRLKVAYGLTETSATSGSSESQESPGGY